MTARPRRERPYLAVLGTLSCVVDAPNLGVARARAALAFKHSTSRRVDPADIRVRRAEPATVDTHARLFDRFGAPRPRKGGVS